MIAMIMAIKVKPQHLASFREEIRTEAFHSAREPGCLRFDVLEDATDPLTFFLYEVFRDEAALDEHRKAPHNLRWLEISKGWRDESFRSRNVCRVVYSREWETVGN